ncbi:MAG: transposase [Gammaproteobacteria bacterium]|nr:transposase [Gammaproteobacteria bacterium]
MRQYKIEQHWDDMMHIAGSLKLGTVQASVGCAGSVTGSVLPQRRWAGGAHPWAWDGCCGCMLVAPTVLWLLGPRHRGCDLRQSGDPALRWH